MTTITTQLEGEYILKVNSPRGDREYRFKNLILDAGLDRIMTTTPIGFIQIGTGTTPPAATDTALQARVASTSTTQGATTSSYTAGPPDYITLGITYRFDVAALNGNFSEVGIGWASAGSLFSRALITDSGGNPITLTVLSDEQLDVTYRMRVYPQQADSTGTVVLGGVTHNYTLRPARVNLMESGSRGWGFRMLSSGFTSAGPTASAWSDAITSRTSEPSLNGSSVSTVTPQAYTNGTYARTVKFTWDLNTGNVPGGIRSVSLGMYGTGFICIQAHQIEFSPLIAKDATKRLTLDVRYSIARRP